MAEENNCDQVTAGSIRVESNIANSDLSTLTPEEISNSILIDDFRDAKRMFLSSIILVQNYSLILKQ